MSAARRWRVRVAPWARPHVADPAALAAALREAATRPDEILRDDHRSRVLVLERLPATSAASGLPVGPWVLKRPLCRDRRAWNRLGSLWSRGEMARSFAASLRLLELGLATPRPLLVMEGRCLGLLVESWLAYLHVPGRPAGPEEWPAVVAALSRLHAAGLRHRDPHLANWLADGRGGVVALDPGVRRLRPGLGDAAYDFVLLRNCRPELLPLLPLRGTWAWHLAELRNAWVQGWRRLKRRWRRRGAG